MTFTSVGDDFPIQQERVRECLATYKKLDDKGNCSFAIQVCESALKIADRAAIRGDLDEILGAYQLLKDIQ